MRRVDHITADKLGEGNGASFKVREVLEGELMQEIDKYVYFASLCVVGLELTLC